MEKIHIIKINFHINLYNLVLQKYPSFLTEK